MTQFRIQHSIDGLRETIRVDLAGADAKRIVWLPLVVFYTLVGVAVATLSFYLVEPFWAAIYTIGSWAFLWLTRPRMERVMLRRIRSSPEKLRWYTSVLALEVLPDGLAYDSGEVSGVLRWRDATIDADGPSHLLLRGAPAGTLCLPLAELPVERLEQIREALASAPDSRR